MNISTDPNYAPPLPKQTVTQAHAVDFSLYDVYKALASIKGHSTGPDGLPSWLISPMAHLLTKPVTDLFICSLTNSYVPIHWRLSRPTITPIPKIARPLKESDFRPISITSILSRILEKMVLRRYFFPFITQPISNRNFTDQFAFRPTGSTSAALISITHELQSMLQSEPYVRLLSLDFSKAFDTVGHKYLADQLASQPIPDFLYNWVLALLHERQHCTKYAGVISPLFIINASIVQGSGLGPTNFVIAISSLKPRQNGNRLLKYADDSYLLIPASCIDSTL